MYKVFINDKVICFTNNIQNCNPFTNGLVLNFFLPNITPFIIDLLYKDDKIKTVIIAVDEYESAFETFQEYFKIIKAAGGVVNNINDEKLFIFRLGKWDLPKGKIESGEQIEEAAIREIEEECGISELSINRKLGDTFHIYQLNDSWILKQTYWFEMKTSFKGGLVPQQEEGITKVEWLTNEKIKDKVLNNTYASIKELLTSNGYFVSS